MTTRRAPIPPGMRLMIGLLAASPLFQAGAVLSGRGFLNFGGGSAWSHAVHFVIAPVVAYLLVTRHERARFSMYVFLTFEAYRGLKVSSPTLVVLALLGIAYVQLPSVLEAYPRVDARKVLSRFRGFGRPEPVSP